MAQATCTTKGEHCENCGAPNPDTIASGSNPTTYTPNLNAGA